MVDIIFFDLDGTLVNSLNTISYYANLALKENGIIIREEKNKKDWNSFLCDKA